MERSRKKKNSLKTESNIVSCSRDTAAELEKPRRFPKRKILFPLALCLAKRSFFRQLYGTQQVKKKNKKTTKIRKNRENVCGKKSYLKTQVHRKKKTEERGLTTRLGSTVNDLQYMCGREIYDRGTAAFFAKNKNLHDGASTPKPVGKPLLFCSMVTCTIAIYCVPLFCLKCMVFERRGSLTQNCRKFTIFLSHDSRRAPVNRPWDSFHR